MPCITWDTGRLITEHLEKNGCEEEELKLCLMRSG